MESSLSCRTYACGPTGLLQRVPVGARDRRSGTGGAGAPTQPFYQTPPNAWWIRAGYEDDDWAAGKSSMEMRQDAGRVTAPISGSSRELPPTRMRYAPPATFQPWAFVLQ